MISYAASCYGKLPFHGDFIRQGTPPKELSMLDAWVSEGLLQAQSVLGESYANEYRSFPAQRFLFTPEGSKNLVTGVIRTGHDKTNRRYPFMILTATDARPLRKRPSLLPLLLEGFLGRAHDLAVTASASPSLVTLQGQIGAISGKVDEKAAENSLDARLKSPLSTLWSKLLNGPDDNRRFVLIQNVKNLMSAASRPRFALRLPCHDDLDAALWFEAAAIVHGHGPTFATWSRDGLNMVMVDPGPTHFVPLIMPKSPTEEACDLANEGYPSLLESARGEVGPLVDDASATIAQFLKKL